MQQIAIVLNFYYSNDGQAYVLKRLVECFSKKGIDARVIDSFEEACDMPNDAIFFSKDLVLARQLERLGVRLFNSSKAIELCDDKSKTYQEIDAEWGKYVELIPTLFTPMSYKKLAETDKFFLDYVEHYLQYPLIAKHNTGSLGGGVFKLDNRKELDEFFILNSDIAHSYQKLIGQAGTDYRVYTIGGKAIAGLKRENKKSFISNIEHGGVGELIELDRELIQLSERISSALNLDYGAIDFLKSESDNKYYFLEANSNAYFKTIERLGVDIAGRLVDYICEKI